MAKMLAFSCLRRQPGPDRYSYVLRLIADANAAGLSDTAAGELC